ncbi:MAG TPA: hypothetical protein VK013_06765 [Myxococcaceae bacterium]|nr:hypothetical protein [Myxococcaceae bacterium]
MHTPLKAASAILVASLLCAPVATAASTVEVLELELDFICSSRAQRTVLLTADSEAFLKIPDDCPARGAEWKVSLSCSKECSGKIRDAVGRTLGTFSGPRSAVGLTPAQQEGPGAIHWVRVAGVKRLSAAAPELLWDVPLSLTFRGDRFASSYLLDPSGSAVLASPVPGSEATLSARVKALPKQKLQLQLLSGKDLVFRQTVSLHEAISVECDVLGEWCQGTATVTLEPHRPQQLDARAEE